MITRHHDIGSIRSTATYSDCERYRYRLRRQWSGGPRLLYILLNPSKATELANDPTIERCERRARALGFGAFEVANIFAWRDTDPAAMKAAADPSGPNNDAILRRAAGAADVILCGWGTHGVYLGRGPAVEAALRRQTKPLHVLGLTRDGHPRHPLYVGYATQPKIWTAARP